MTTKTEPAAVQHTYSPRGACLALFKTKAPEVLVWGPAGTGKSRACLEKLHAVAMANPGMRALIVRKTAVSLTSSALVTFRRDVLSEALLAGIVRWYGGSAEKPPQYIYENGSTVSIGGMDKPSKILSTEYDAVYIQEATELTVEDWETLSTRVRNGVVSFQQIIADCNPDVANHWLRARSLGDSVVSLESHHTDNPRLYEETKGDVFDVERGGVRFRLTGYGRDYMGRLGALTGVRRQRLLEGKWVSAEGVIYDEFDPLVHLVDRFPVPDSWPRLWAIDWGFTHPTVIQQWAEDGDGRLFMYREWYYSGRLVSDHAAAVMRVVAPGGELRDGRYVGGEWIEPKPRVVVADHDPEAQEQFRRVTGLKPRNAEKSVGAGIQAVQKRLRVAGDGRPRLFFMRDCLVERDGTLAERWLPTSTVEEMGGYVWSDRKDESPVKENDDGVDTMRYVVMAADRPSVPRFRWVS